MNLYFVLEGETTEPELYPYWISLLIPKLKQVDFEKEVDENNYYIFSAGGIPSIYNHTINAIKNINQNPVFDKLIVCLDAEELEVEEQIQEVKSRIEQAHIVLNENCTLEIVVQNICIETWFLGNNKFIKRAPDNSNLGSYLQHYDVLGLDPEKMPKENKFRTKAQYHYSYFKESAKEHNLKYTKSNIEIVKTEPFLNQLIRRVNDTNHLSSFKSLYTLLNEINQNIK